MNKLIAILVIGMVGCAFSATQTSKEYVDAQDTDLHNEIVGHKEDADNPHGVTAGQVGAYTKGEADEKFISEETDPNVPEWAKSPLPPTAKIESVNGKTGVVELVANDIGAYSKSETDNKIQSAKPGNYSVVSNNAMNAVQEELDPNVPEWAKRVNKPTYTATEVGARPNDWLPSTAEIGAQPKLVSGANIKTVNGNSLLGSGNVIIRVGVSNSVDGAARPLPKYLHALDFDDTYPYEAAEYYRSRGDGRTDGGCSAVRDDGFLYRNFDYPFDERAEFVVKMSAGAGRFASVGVAQVGTNLTEAIVTSGNPNRCYKWLPGATVDGINENGVVCEINVCGGDPHEDSWYTTGDIHPLGAIRWVLDNGTSAGMAASNLASRIKFPEGWTQNFHYTVADERETWYVEGGVAYEWQDPLQRFVLTNWRIADKYNPESMLTEAGVERDALLYIFGLNITNAWYTNAYRRETNPPWVSDLREVLAYTNEIFDAWAAYPKEYFRGKTNNGIPWWQSVHTSVYDITNCTLRVAVQEVNDWYTFAVPSAGGGSGGVDTNAVEQIANAAVWTNAVTRALISATNDLTAAVGGKFSKEGGTIIKQEEILESAYVDVRSRSGGGVRIEAPNAGIEPPKIEMTPNEGGGVSPVIVLHDSDAPETYAGRAEVIIGDMRVRDTLAVKRDLTNNVCASSSFGPWDYSGPYRLVFESTRWVLRNVSDQNMGTYAGAEDSTIITLIDGEPGLPEELHRQRFATSGETFVTPTFVTNETAKVAAAAVSPGTVTNIINAKVSANLNTYIDKETGVEYVGDWYGGSMYYVPTGNVYPPNENN